MADANLLVATALPLAYSRAAVTRMRDWVEVGVPIHAPRLWGFEAVSALRKHVAASRLAEDELEPTLLRLLTLPVREVSFDANLYLEALRWAERMKATVAYDASYLALADHLDAELWTADQGLVKRARAAGSSRVRNLLDGQSESRDGWT